MVRNSYPSGEIALTEDELRAEYRKVFNKRPAKASFSEMITTLVDAGIVPSRTAVYPASRTGDMSDDQKARLAAVIEHMEASMADVRPDRERVDHFRVFATLHATNALEAAAKGRRRTLQGQDGKAALAQNATVPYTGLEWDYGVIGKWVAEYGVDTVCDTIMRIHIAGRFAPILEQPTFHKRRDGLRAYIMAVLRNGGVPSQYDSEVRDDILTYEY